MLDRIQAFFPLPRIGTCASDVHSVTQNALRLSCSVSKRVIDIRRYGQWDTVTSAEVQFLTKTRYTRTELSILLRVTTSDIGLLRANI